MIPKCSLRWYVTCRYYHPVEGNKANHPQICQAQCINTVRDCAHYCLTCQHQQLQKDASTKVNPKPDLPSHIHPSKWPASRAKDPRGSPHASHLLATPSPSHKAAKHSTQAAQPEHVQVHSPKRQTQQSICIYTRMCVCAASCGCRCAGVLPIIGMNMWAYVAECG